MALTSIGAQLLFPDRLPLTIGGATINAANEFCWATIPIHVAGAITGLVWRTSTVGTSKSMKIGIKGREPGTSRPTAAYLGATNAAYGTQASVVTSTVYETTLGESVTVAAGDMICVTWGWSDDGDPGNVTVSTRASADIFQGTRGATFAANAYTGSYEPTTYVPATGGIPLVGLNYNGTYYVQYAAMPPYTTISETGGTIDADGTYNAFGNRFTPPITSRAIGLRFRADIEADITAAIYADDGTTLLASTAVATAERPQTVVGDAIALFATPITLTAGTYYKMVLTTASNTATTIASLTFASTALMRQIAATDCYMTRRAVADGAWTTVTTEVAAVAVILDQVDTGSAGGSGGTYGY